MRKAGDRAGPTRDASPPPLNAPASIWHGQEAPSGWGTVPRPPTRFAGGPLPLPKWERDSSSNHPKWALDQLLKALHQRGAVGAVDGAVVEATGGAHHGGDLEAVVDDVGALLAGADGHDHALGRVDDGLELLDAVHAPVREARGAALVFVRLELAVAGAGGGVDRK